MLFLCVSPDSLDLSILSPHGSLVAGPIPAPAWRLLPHFQSCCHQNLSLAPTVASSLASLHSGHTCPLPEALGCDRGPRLEFQPPVLQVPMGPSSREPAPTSLWVGLCALQVRNSPSFLYLENPPISRGFFRSALSCPGSLSYFFLCPRW